MRLETLVRELQGEAEEIHRWPVPDLAALRRGRERRRRNQVLLGGLATACAAAAVAVAVVTPRTGVGTPVPAPVGPAASPTATPAGTVGRRDWTEAGNDRTRRLRCAGPGRCTVPMQISVNGRRLFSPQSGSLPTQHGRVRSADLSLSVSRRHGPVWVLVGATGSADSSDLAVRFGSGPWQPLASGRLSLVRVPPVSASPVDVRVRERARPLPREVLEIGVYSAR
jgi:hypothetical protein